jgi:cbb3-type cytochrome oxidase subunit 3
MPTKVLSIISPSQYCSGNIMSISTLKKAFNPSQSTGAGRTISAIFMVILFLPLIAITLGLGFMAVASLISQEYGEFVLTGVLSVFSALITAFVWRNVKSKRAALAEQENKAVS